MKIVVLDQLVRHNLSLFRHLIQRHAEKARQYYQVARKAYRAFVNVHTGEIRFQELEHGFKPTRDWCPIIIQLRPNSDGAFEVLQQDHEDAFDCKLLEPEAYLMLSKTMHLLNQLSYDPKNGKNPFWILRHVAHVEFLISEGGEQDVIHHAWHTCNRREAEILLRELSPGTYLFRKGEFASLLENVLSETLARSVTCITLTYCDAEQKIGEKTLVHSGGSWMVFNDDLQLRGPRFESIKQLLASFAQLTRPLMAA